MGVIVYGSYNLIMLAIKSNLIACIISIILGMIVYAVAMLLMRGITRRDMERIPKGEILITIADRLHLLR